LSTKIRKILNFSTLIISALGLLVFYSCSGSKGNLKLQGIPVKEIKNRVNTNSKILESLEADGTISFDSPDNSGSGDIEIKIIKPDSVFVKITGPFGVSVATALITRNDFIYYNVQENKVITGPSTELNIGAILRIGVTFDELINSFSGSFHFPDESTDSTDALSENSMYVLQLSQPEGIERYLIEPSQFAIKQYFLLDPDFQTRIQVGYSDYTYELVGGKTLNFPNKIVIKNPSKKQSVYLEYQDKAINKKDISIKIRVPKSAKIVKLE